MGCFPHCPWVWPLIRIAAYIRTTLLSDHIVAIYIPPQKSASGPVLCSGDDAIDGDRSCSNTTPLLPLLVAGGPPVKIHPGSLYGGAVQIAPEDGNTRGIERPPRCGHQFSGCRLHCNRLEIEAYTRSILPTNRSIGSGRQFRKLVLFTGRYRPPPGPGIPLRPVGSKIRQSVLTGPVVVDPLLIVVFWCFSIIHLHIWVRPLLWIFDFLLNYLTKRS